VNHWLKSNAKRSTGSQGWAYCEASIADDSEVTIVATGVQQAYRLSQGNKVRPVFDVVVLDESSQIPVTKALSPLARLKPDSRLIVFAVSIAVRS
jgi:hypothetical protein